jgi:hypothetical protein
MTALRGLLAETLAFMETSFRRLEEQVPEPKWQRTIHGLQARYDERSIQQALVQKLFRTITGLHALELLLFNGLAQEQGVIQRVLDELGEDIQFLAHAVTMGTVTPLHEAYLADFWAEEFDHHDPLKATQKRKTVSREKVCPTMHAASLRLTRRATKRCGERFRKPIPASCTERHRT